MAAVPLFDTSNLDFSSVALDREELKRWLPHRHHMLMLDAVVWHDDDCDHGVAVKHVRDDEFWCAGHIPDYPLMPGVLMVEAGAQLASVLYYKRSGNDWFAGFTRIENTAFRGQVLPGDTLYILCKCLRYHTKRFITQIQGIIDGNIVFDSTITGMAFPQVLAGKSLIDGNAKPKNLTPQP